MPNREELYKKQLRELFGKGDFSCFVTKDFICPSCHSDILKDDRTLKEALEGTLITGCPFCARSYCD